VGRRERNRKHVLLLYKVRGENVHQVLHNIKNKMEGGKSILAAAQLTSYKARTALPSGEIKTKRGVLGHLHPERREAQSHNLRRNAGRVKKIRGPRAKKNVTAAYKKLNNQLCNGFETRRKGRQWRANKCALNRTARLSAHTVKARERAHRRGPGGEKIMGSYISSNNKGYVILEILVGEVLRWT